MTHMRAIFIRHGESTGNAGVPCHDLAAIELTERGHEPPLGPARIIVYRRPLTEMCDSVQELREEIRITVLHEIGHHFGIDEDRLDELGYA